jgi:hypothetical protein
MADEEQLAVLRRGSDVWNAWREQNPDVRVNLTGANLCGATFPRRTFARRLSPRRSSGGLTSTGRISRGRTSRWRASSGRISPTQISAMRTSPMQFSPGRTSSGRNSSTLCWSTEGANLSNADLHNANLERAYLVQAILVDTDLTGADLTDCRVYGISTWNLKLEGATQKNLIITSHYEPDITVDNLEVAQFIHLLLHNERLRHVIDTITSKVVLILGRFTKERKAVLDALREELRQCDYVPVLFDFEKPASKDLTGTVQTLANMARFVIADLTDATSVPHELAMVVPNTPVAVQPVLLEGQREYAMFVDLRKRHHWVLEPYRYASRNGLIADLSEHVIVPAEAKARELQGTSTPTR